jgi:hypothetical protein
MESTANTSPQKQRFATYTGRCSSFGGPFDKGVAPNEGLALYEHSDVPHNPSLFLSEQPVGTSGVARRLNPEAYYCAMRWNYHLTPVKYLKDIKVKVTNSKGVSVFVNPVDWGPNIDTHRIVDLSPGVLKALDLTTNDNVTVEVPLPG